MSITGTLERQENFPSRFITARHVDVWLPDRYLENTADRYPVIYMHDGLGNRLWRLRLEG
jgi:predicted alpha/beta superfamily hydrolase